MSAPIAAEVMRELGAEVIVFGSLKKAVKWYDAYGLRMRRCTKDVSSVGSPVSRSRAERERATYAALLCCFRWRDPGVDEESLRNLLEATMDFVCGGRSLHYLAEENGLTEHGFSLWVARGERVLRGRLRARGLLRIEYCECGCGVEQAREGE